MPSLGQYKRYIQQGEIKLSKLNSQLATAQASKKSELKTEIKELSAKLKEHKANMKLASVSAKNVPAKKTAPASKGKVAAKTVKAVVEAKAPTTAAPSVSKAKFDALVATVNGLKTQIALLSEKVSSMSECCQNTNESSDNSCDNNSCNNG